MAADEQMPLSLPDTQNADILTQSQSGESEINSQGPTRIWGKLYPLENALEKIEMTKDVYIMGRAPTCDICVADKPLSERRKSVMSKQHFKIIKETVNGGMEDFVAYLEDTSHNGTFVNRQRIGYGNKVILENNDTIAVAQAGFTVYTYMSTRSSDNSGLPPELKCKYVVSRTLGSGVCGEVKMIFTKNGCKRFALKTITKNKFLSVDAKQAFKDHEKMMTEVRILQNLKHPCIIKMEEILDTPSSVYIVLELMEGGELFDRIRKRGNGLAEKTTKLIFYQVILAVHYLHERGITHRDLKPENILLATNNELTLVKVSDFGLSKFVDTQTIMTTFCGTPMYVAPEVLLTHGRGSYTSQVDIWSLGVILYCCLSGMVPFSAHHKELSLQQQIVRGIYGFPKKCFNHVSTRALDLIQRMMTVNPQKRITINQVLLHSWLADRQMRSIVGHLMDEEHAIKENLAPISRPSTSNANVVCRIEPCNTGYKRPRVD